MGFTEASEWSFLAFPVFLVDPRVLQLKAHGGEGRHHLQDFLVALRAIHSYFIECKHFF